MFTTVIVFVLVMATALRLFASPPSHLERQRWRGF